MNLEATPLPCVTLWTCWEKGQGKSKRGTSNSTCLFSAAFDLCGKEDIKKVPLSLLEKENGLGVYCKGNENKARSKRMLASSRNWVKEGEESETNVIWDSPRKRLRVWAGSKAAHPKERGHLGSWELKVWGTGSAEKGSERSVCQLKYKGLKAG